MYFYGINAVERNFILYLTTHLSLGFEIFYFLKSWSVWYRKKHATKIKNVTLDLSEENRQTFYKLPQSVQTFQALVNVNYFLSFFVHFQNHFVVDDVSKIIKEAIENTIGGNAYLHDKVNNWTGAVVESCLSVLTKLQKPYKYIGELELKLMKIQRKWNEIFGWFSFSVTCTIMQKNGAGLHTASSCFWNNETDGSCTVRWENKTMYCIVSVFGLAL